MAAAGGGDEQEVKLLGMWASPFVLRVKLALSLKGIPHEYIEQNLHSKSELLLLSNPVHHKVPVLIHAGRPVCESSVILHYLDDAFPSSAALLPADPHARAVARFWAAYVDDVLVKASTQASMGKTAEEKAEGKEKAAAAVVTLEGALRECSNGGEKPFFGGESAGYVDVVLGGLLGWVRATDAMQDTKTFDPATTPLLAAWADRIFALDGVEAAMPDVGKLIEFAMMLRARGGAAAAAAAN